jgi:hypothetical protein
MPSSQARKLARATRFAAARESQSQSDQIRSKISALPESELLLVSAAQFAANQANAQLSTGPVTPEGKAACSKNSLKHGLTSCEVLIPTDDPAEWQRKLDATVEFYAPATQQELDLVEQIAANHWRVRRSHVIENGLHAKGQRELKEAAAKLDRAEREEFLTTEGFLKYEKSIRNLQLQRNRVMRHIEKDIASLNALQDERKRAERKAEQLRKAGASPGKPTTLETNDSTPNSENGFVFTSDLEEQPDLPESSFDTGSFNPEQG